MKFKNVTKKKYCCNINDKKIYNNKEIKSLV